jgi:putative ATP-grasp target RiPP
VVDPHKHGLQPYGCGAVLFHDPEGGRFYLHEWSHATYLWPTVRTTVDQACEKGESMYEYDPARQLNVLPDGTPVIDTDAMIGPTMTHSSGDSGGPRKDDD